MVTSKKGDGVHVIVVNATVGRNNGGVRGLKVQVSSKLSNLQKEQVGCGVVLEQNDPRLGFIGAHL